MSERPGEQRREPGRIYLLGLVTVTGASVLALEILGTRVVGTCYGSSLYVWAALLSVTLTCLAAGYAVGGRLADRLPRAWMLYSLVVLAGGMFPRVMEFYDIDWTAVEIDVKVAELAKAYFGYRGDIFYPDGTLHRVDLERFPNREVGVPGEEQRRAHRPPGPYRGRAVIQDGRQYLRRHEEPVDFVVLDAYNSDVIPFHLITREFFELTKQRLTEDGILAINYIGRPTGDFVTDSLFRTLGDVFGRNMVRAYRTTNDASAVQVIIVFAFRRPMQLLPLWQSWQPSVGVDRLSYELSRRRLETDRPGAVTITDDHNPIALARAETALAWRRQTAALLR